MEEKSSFFLLRARISVLKNISISRSFNFSFLPGSNFYFHKFRKENILKEWMRRSFFFFFFFLALRYLILIFLGTREEEKIRINILFVRVISKGRILLKKKEKKEEGQKSPRDGAQ